MARVLSEAASRGILPEYVAKLLAAFEAEKQSDLNPSLGKSGDNQLKSQPNP